ncbi:hypothetical protein, partial [Herbiconiux daphne]
MQNPEDLATLQALEQHRVNKMKAKIIAGVITLLSLSAHAENYAIDCEGHAAAYMTIEQGEHRLAVIGNPIEYKYTASDAEYAVKNHPDPVTK